MNITDAWLRQTDAEAHATRGADLPGCMYRRAAVWGYAAACAVVLTVAVRHILYSGGYLSCGACLPQPMRFVLSGGTARPLLTFTLGARCWLLCLQSSVTLSLHSDNSIHLIGLQNNICPASRQSWVVGHVFSYRCLNLGCNQRQQRRRKL